MPGVEIALGRRAARTPRRRSRARARGRPRAPGSRAGACRRPAGRRGSPRAAHPRARRGACRPPASARWRSGPEVVQSCVIKLALSSGSLRVYGTRMTPSHRISLPDAARAVYRAIAALDSSAELEPRLRELVRIRASQINGCAFCVDMHSRRRAEGRRGRPAHLRPGRLAREPVLRRARARRAGADRCA